MKYVTYDNYYFFDINFFRMFCVATYRYDESMMKSDVISELPI